MENVNATTTTPQQQGGDGASTGGTPPEPINIPSSNRDKFFDNMRSKYGADLTDEDIYARSMEAYDAEHEYAKGQRGSSKELGDLISKDENLKEFISDIVSGKGMAAAARNLPEGYDKVGADSDAVHEYQALMNEEAKQREQIVGEVEGIMNNLNNSQDAIRAYVEEKGLPQEEAEEMISDLVERVIKPVAEGKLTPEVLELFDKGRKYDNDLSVANEAGKVAGRNERIIEKRKTLDTSIDGLPQNGGSGNGSVDDKSEQGITDVEFFRQLAERRR